MRSLYATSSPEGRCAETRNVQDKQLAFTCQQAEETLAAHAVPHEEGVGRAPVAELHVDALRAEPHLQVAERRDGVAVPLLQPIGELAPAGRETALNLTDTLEARRFKMFICWLLLFFFF